MVGTISHTVSLTRDWLRAESREEKCRLRRRLTCHVVLAIAGGGIILASALLLLSPELAVFAAAMTDVIREILDYAGKW